MLYKNNSDKGSRPEEQSPQHLLAHTILGAAVSYATGQDIGIGALSAAGSEAVTPILSDFLFGKKPNELSQDEKDTIANIVSLVTATTTYTTTGGDVANTVNAVEVGRVGVEWNAVNKSQVGTVEDLSKLLNNTKRRVGLFRNEKAHEYLLSLNETDFKYEPQQTGFLNNKKARYIYTEKGGWIDMVHFLFYASEAYNFKNDLLNNPANADRLYINNQIIDYSINYAVKKGYIQERIDLITAPHSAYSYEDLPSDYHGAVFGAKYFNPQSPLTFAQQISNYLQHELKATMPNHAPNYMDLPKTDTGKHSGIQNKTIKPLFTK